MDTLITNQDFKAIVEKLAELSDKNGLTYKTPFREVYGKIVGFESFNGDVMLDQDTGNIIYSNDYNEEWIELQFTTVPEVVDYIWWYLSSP